MALKINFNAESAVTHTALLRNERAMNKSLLRISTGNRILSAADDAAGLFIADQLNIVAAALEQGNRNIQTGISALQIAETNVGQIFEKLQTIYTKAQSAANDVNDPNARGALQRDISFLVDAIQKIGTDTEYNGIKLLDGTFSDKVIHYGPRVNQTISVALQDVRATALGAYILEGSGKITTSSTSAYSTLVSGDWAFNAGDKVVIDNLNIASRISTGAVDAYEIAKAINEDRNLQLKGISARASNSITGTTWSGINVTMSATGTNSSTVTATLRFVEGSNTNTAGSGAIVITASTTGVNTTDTIFANIDDLVEQINSQALNRSLTIRARNDGGKLVLTSAEGKTIGVELSLSANVATSATVNASFNLGQILGSSVNTNISINSATSSTGVTGSGIKVGNLTVSGIDPYNYDFTGISTASAGLGVGATGSANAYDLTTLKVTTNEGAERALDVVIKALQKVDKIRTEIGSVINNLQAIWDGQKASYDNTKEAENVIRNTDFAAEMSTFVTMQIRMQSGVAMLAQANALPQLVLQLLR